ncbi:hypothetical protein ACJA25_00425 [Mycoplasmopsis hyopharyngis]|uniref:hypothetical protein n=1 Tax=Mycoplasmopsis hyopharyngis TaxID=29558 RepID=UPI0038739F3B
MQLNYEKKFGSDSNIEFDFSGRQMKKEYYNMQNQNEGWNIDHIRPLWEKGTNQECNLEIMNIKSNAEKSNHYPHFKANNQNWKVVRNKKNYKIVKDDN